MNQTARPLPVTDQLANAIAPAARQPDGSYQVSIRLHPEELGVVHVELHVEAGVVNVSVHAEGDATRDLLRQNLGQLRQQLANSGLATGHFDVGSGSQHTGQGEGQPPTVPALGPPAPDGQDPVTAVGPASEPALLPSVDGALDVRL